MEFAIRDCLLQSGSLLACDKAWKEEKLKPRFINLLKILEGIDKIPYKLAL